MKMKCEGAYSSVTSRMCGCANDVVTPPHPHPHPPTQCYVDSMLQKMTTVASLPDARHLKQAYANAYVSYAICMGAYAWGVICLVAVEFPLYLRFCRRKENKMQPTSPNAHTYVKGTDVETHEYAVTQNTFLKQFFFEQSCTFFPCYHTSAP